MEARRDRPPFEIRRETQIADLGGKIYVRALETGEGRCFIDIRKHFQNDEGQVVPTGKGVMLSPDKWAKLVQNISEWDDQFQSFLS